MNNYSTPFFKKVLTLAFTISLFFIGISNVNATHLIGGNVGYQNLGPNPNVAGEVLFKITLDAYQDCNSDNWVTAGGTFPERNIQVGIYQGIYSPTSAISNHSQVTLTLIDSNGVDANLPPICDPHSLLQDLCVYLIRYEATVSLPASFQGYWIVYDRCCRPAQILNLSNSGDQSFVYSTWIPPTIVVNNTAQFTDTLLSYICRTDTAYISNTAIDPDGDSLVYTLETPFVGLTGNGSGGNNQPVLNYTTFPMNPYTIPPSGVVYAPGYNLANLLGPSSYSSVDQNTGITRFLTYDKGTFVASVEIKEYRNDTLVGMTRRNMQLISDDCPNNNMPNQDTTNLDPSASSALNYVVDAGDTLCFSLDYSDMDGDPLRFEATSDIFNSAITNPTATVTSPVIGNGSVTGTICWQPSCAQGRSAPYIVDVVVTDSNCPPLPLPQLVYIKVVPFEGPTQIFSDSVICLSNNTPSLVTADTLSNVNYTWTVTGGTIVSGNGTPSISINWNNTLATGTISLTTTNPNGCTAGPLTRQVTLSDVSTDAGSDQAMCLGIPVTIGGSPTSTNINNTVAWNPTIGLNNATLQNPIANPATTTDYEVSVTNARGCVGKDTVTITVNNTISSGVLNDYFLCPGDTLNMTATGNTFTWSPNLFISNVTIANPELYPPSNQNYTLNYFDINGCEGNDTIDITVNQTVPTDAGPDAQICSGDSFTLGGNPSAPFGTTYIWSPNANMNNDTLANPGILQPVGSTVYTVVTSNDTCRGIDSIRVTVLASPTLTVTNNTYVCDGDSIQLFANGTGSFLWNNGISLNDSTIADPLAFPSSPTTYTVTLTDANSCESTDSVFIDIQSLPIASAGDTIDACKFSPTAIGGSPTGPAGSTYFWTPSTGLDNVTSANPLASLDNNQVYMVEVTDSLGCSSIDTVLVEIFRLSGLSDTTICNNDLYTLSTSPSHGLGPYTYEWSNGSLLSDSTIGSPSVQVQGPNTFTVTVTDANNCTDTVIFKIDLFAITQSVFTYEVIPACEGVGVQVTDNSIGAVSYEWLIDGKVVSTDATPLLNLEYNQNVTLSLITTSADGCRDTSEAQVTGPQFDDLVDIQVSNVFTPNGDGANDYFEIQSNGDLSDCIELIIYNRSGQKVFESSGGIHTWDGRSTTGEIYPDGVYYYIYTINGTEYKGNVTLLK